MFVKRRPDHWHPTTFIEPDAIHNKNHRKIAATRRIKMLFSIYFLHNETLMFPNRNGKSRKTIETFVFSLSFRLFGLFVRMRRIASNPSPQRKRKMHKHTQSAKEMPTHSSTVVGIVNATTTINETKSKTFSIWMGGKRTMRFIFFFYFIFRWQ